MPDFSKINKRRTSPLTRKNRRKHTQAVAGAALEIFPGFGKLGFQEWLWTAGFRVWGGSNTALVLTVVLRIFQKTKITRKKFLSREFYMEMYPSG